MNSSTYYPQIQKIADAYGYSSQSRKCIGKMEKLRQAIDEYYRDRDSEYANKYPFYPPDEYLPNDFTSYDNLIEGISDMQIMLWQMAYLLNANVKPIIEQKLNEQLERIEKCTNS